MMSVIVIMGAAELLLLLLIVVLGHDAPGLVKYLRVST